VSGQRRLIAAVAPVQYTTLALLKWRAARWRGGSEIVSYEISIGCRIGPAVNSMPVRLDAVSSKSRNETCVATVCRPGGRLLSGWANPKIINPK